MTAHIYSWIDGYVALRARAFDVCGSIELDTGARWPRTAGEDAVAIAALFDSAIRTHATPGVMLRWRATLTDLEREAVAEPHRTYAENRTLWSSIEAAAVFLDDVAATPPSPAMWDALIDQIGVHPRNAGPSSKDPFGLSAPTFDDLWRVQRDLFAQKHGFDQPEPPPGMGMKGMKIPRTTNAEVIQIAAYWTDQLAKVRAVVGYQAAVEKWRTALADIDKLAKPGKPDEVYAKNNEFWHTLNNVAVQIAIGDEAPPKSDLAMESIKDSVTHLPETLEHAIEGAAHAVGKAANEAGKGLFSGLGAPFLIGAGLLGLFLITRHRDHEEA